MAIYAMSDIRGCYDKFIQMLELIKYDPDDCLILVGNSIDNNNPNGSAKMIEWILNNTRKTFNRLFVLKGINEKELVQEINQSSYIKYNNMIKELIQHGYSCEQVKKRFEHIPFCFRIKADSYTFLLASTGTPSNNCNDCNREQFSLYSSYKKLIFYGGCKVSFYYNIFGCYPTTHYYNDNDERGRITYQTFRNIKFANINCGVYLPKEKGKLGCLELNDLIEYYV